MRVLNFIACGLVAGDAGVLPETDPVSLLQTSVVRFHKHGRYNATQNPVSPESLQCPRGHHPQETQLAMVQKNNLCGYDGAGPTELRFRNVMKIVDQGREQDLDLVIKPTGDFKCTNKVNNDKNGAEGAKFGAIVIPVGTEAEFSFSYVKTETDDLANVDLFPFSFLDLDQGKKGKQRESVEVCGVKNVVLAPNTELEKSVSGDCIKVTSTTRGNNKDNPHAPEDMSADDRSRAIAFQMTGASFTAKLGVSKGGRRGRKIMFTGNPTVSCGEKMAIAALPEWRCLDFWNDRSGCTERRLGQHASKEQCQEEAEKGGFQGFIQKGGCCLKNFNVADLRENMVPDHAAGTFCYLFAGDDPLPDFAELDNQFKCYNKEDAWPGCNDVGYFKSKKLCKQEAMIKGFQGFGKIMGGPNDGQCCLKKYNPEDLQSNLIKDDNVEFCDWQANHDGKWGFR